MNSHNEDNDEGSTQHSGDSHNINATETVDNGSVPGEVSLWGGSIANQSGRDGDVFAPRGNSGGSSRQRSSGSSH